MKKIIQRVQDLGQKAGELRTVVEGIPGQAARLRDTVLVTAGQLQDMRRDVQASVAGLRATNDDGIAAALNDLQAGADEIRKAGYEMSGVEMELDPVQRLLVLLDKVADVRASELQSLLAANASRRTLHGLLSSLIKAEEFAARCGLRELDYCQLRVSVGPIPSIRLIWRAAEMEAASVPPALPTSALNPAPTTASIAAQPTPSGVDAPPSVQASSLFGKDSFFERRAMAPLSGQVATAPVAMTEEFADTEPATAGVPIEVSIPQKPAAAASRTTGDWRSSALDRFKQMPDLSKR